MSSAVDTLLDAVAWEAAPTREPSADGLPHITHSGVFEFLGRELRCYRISDGRAIVNADDLNEFFGLTEEAA